MYFVIIYSPKTVLEGFLFDIQANWLPSFFSLNAEFIYLLDEGPKDIWDRLSLLQKKISSLFPDVYIWSNVILDRFLHDKKIILH